MRADTSLPLVDLHRHLDGNIRPAIAWQLACRYGVDLGVTSAEELQQKMVIADRTSSLLEFLQRLDLGVAALASLDACEQVAFDNMLSAAEEGLAYVELRFSPYYMARPFGLPMEGVIDAVISGVRQGSSQTGVKVNLIGILSRTFGVEACFRELDALLTFADKLVAIDLAGDEKGFPCHLFVEHFRRVRQAGLEVTIHAGEAAGPDSVRAAIELLGASRIGHGVAISRAPDLLELVARQGIGIESCLTSNYQTHTVDDLRCHPLPLFLEAGARVCLNTDDPAVENTTLSQEYALASQLLGLAGSQLEQLKRHAIHMAFLSFQEKQQLLQETS